MLYTAVLVEAPTLFQMTFRALDKVLDARVKAKINFATAKTMEKKMGERLGTEMCTWLSAEVRDNRVKRSKKAPKQYWVCKKGEHDGRGVPSYVGSKVSWFEGY